MQMCLDISKFDFREGEGQDVYLGNGVGGRLKGVLRIWLSKISD